MIAKSKCYRKAAELPTLATQREVRAEIVNARGEATYGALMVPARLRSVSPPRGWGDAVSGVP